MKQNNILIDYYDTLVHRSIPPEEVKRLWAQQLAQLIGIDVDLYPLRFEIERNLCELSFEKYKEHEFIYNEMCIELYNRISNKIYLSQLEFIEHCQRIEIKLEQHAQYIDEKNLTFILEAKQLGSSIYLVSDFYFNKEMYTQLLKYHHLYDLFDDIFISAEYMSSKKTGGLYKVVQKKLDLVNFDNCLMIGDNYHADVTSASQFGIATKHIDATASYDFYQHSLKALNFKQVIDSFSTLFFKNNTVVYAELSLALYLFIIKLHGSLVKNSVKEVLFMSREGEFLKTIFDQYNNLINGNIKSYYFYVSRRATFLPSLDNILTEDFEVLFRQYKNMSIKEFLLNINFDDKQINDVVNYISFDITEKINDFEDSLPFRELKQLEVFKQYYESNRIQQKKYIYEYLARIGCDVRNLHIVDVGWKGSIQDNIAKIFSDSNIFGYYLGLNIATAKINKSTKRGLLFDPESAWDLSTYSSVFNECTAIFEVILGASHGSVEKYLLNGGIGFINNEIEQDLYKSTISIMQQNMLLYIKLVGAILCWKNISTADFEVYVNKKYADFILNPTLDQIKIFDNLYHMESFGVHEVTIFTLMKKSFFREFKLFLSQPKFYINSAFWPAHKLYTGNLKFLIPIYKLYRLWKIKAKYLYRNKGL